MSSRTSDSVPGRATGTWPRVVTTVPTGSAGRPATWAVVAVTAVRRLPHHTSTPASATWAARVVGDAVELRSQPRQQIRPCVHEHDPRPDPDDPASSADQRVEPLLDRHRGLDAGESAAGDRHGEQSRPFDRVPSDGGLRHHRVEMADERLQGSVALGGVAVGVQARHPFGGVAAADTEHEMVVRQAIHALGSHDDDLPAREVDLADRAGDDADPGQEVGQPRQGALEPHVPGQDLRGPAVEGVRPAGRDQRDPYL